jgi:uncharacterized membrane protein
MAGLAIWAERAIPDDARVALHYGLDGTVDRFGDKREAISVLWLMVGLGVFISVLMAAMTRLEPRRDNLSRSPRTYLLAWIGGLLTMLLVSALMATSFVGGVPQDPDFVVRVIFGATGFFILVLGNAMGKVRPNFTMGVRTPWTLSSDIAWDKTHRLAGWVMVVWGLAQIAAAALAPASWSIVVTTLGGVLGMGFVVVASYFYWRDAPDKKPR